MPETHSLREVSPAEKAQSAEEKYYTASFAKQGYEKMTKAQQWQEEVAKNSGRPYFKVTFYQQGPFILKILHYKLKEAYEAGPLVKKKIYLDSATLSRIKMAFESFSF